MIPNILIFSNKNLGSSLSLPAHGWVGVRATSSLAAHFALQNTLSKSAEKKAVPSEGEAEGGCGGNSASPEPKRSPAALLVQSRVPQKSFLFLLEEKIGRAQNKKLRRKLFLRNSERSERRRGGASKFAVWIFVKKSSDFNQKVPPIFKIRILGDYCLAPPLAGLGFGKDFEGIFEIQKQFLPAQTEVRRAKHG